MSTVTAILEPDAAGTVRLPVPPELRSATVRVTATLEALVQTAVRPRFGCLAGKIQLAPGFDEPLEDFREHME